MRMRTIVVGLVGLAFLAGWGASEVVSMRGLVISNAYDEPRVSLGTDATGAGYLIVRNASGEEVFAVRGDTVTGTIRPASATVAPAKEAAEGERIAQLIRVEFGMSPAIVREMTALRVEADLLDQRAADVERDEFLLAERAQINRTNGVGRTVNGRRIVQDYRGRLGELRREAERLRGAARRARARADRMASSSGSQRQRLQCWNGNREIVLVTEDDLTARLAQVPARAYVSWVGRPIGVEGERQVFQVSMIKPAEAPSGFDALE